MMEDVRILVEHIIELCGITGASVPVVRHVLLIVVAVLLAWLGDYACRKVFVPLIVRLTARADTKWVKVVFNKRVLVLACHIVPGIIVWKLLPMVFYQFPVVREILARLTAIYIVILSVRLAVALINSFKALETERHSSARQYFQSFCGVINIIIIFIAVIIVIAIILKKSPMALFAGLGATSAVLMLIFKDTITGLVAGVRMTSNDMVHKGDWITVPGTNADGTIEEITLTTVKIRNSDNTIVTVSPITLVNGSFQNWIGMQQSGGRRVKRLLYFDFRSICVVGNELRHNLTSEGYLKEEDIKAGAINMSLYRRYLEGYLMRRTEVNAEMPLLVRQLEATNTGLPLELYFFLKDKEMKKYEHALAEIMEYVYAIAPSFGLTIYEQTPHQL